MKELKYARHYLPGDDVIVTDGRRITTEVYGKEITGKIVTTRQSHILVARDCGGLVWVTR